MLKEIIRKTPIMGYLARRAYHATKGFRGSSNYWEENYCLGGNSGPGSYGRLAGFKAEIVNSFIAEHQIRSVIEHGCGDGNQVSLGSYPQYLGLDVSRTAVEICQRRFQADATKTFKHVDDYAGETAELALSLDVIFHLVEDEVFSSYMAQVFASAERFIIIYSSNVDKAQRFDLKEVRERCFTSWVEQHRPNWALIRHIQNRYPYAGDAEAGSRSDFFIYAQDDPQSLAERDRRA